MEKAEVPVRVLVRVRPLLPKEKLEDNFSCMWVLPGAKQLAIGHDRSFTFDHVFDPSATQSDVYALSGVKFLIDSFFSGYDATVFAYGQTGSGKTYTITGDSPLLSSEEKRGIISRSVEKIFNKMREFPNRQFKVKVSNVEIYKEEVNDLLDMETSYRKLNVREDEAGNTFVVGAKVVACSQIEDVIDCLITGATVRHTGSTLMNDYSSRSHSVFTVTVEQKWLKYPNNLTELKDSKDHHSHLSDVVHHLTSKFNFVDLAGSERAHRTGNTGERLAESIHINTGLLALGNVISALVDTRKKSSHIPYRDSKLTRILKDSLGGKAKTIMICCVSPSAADFDESLNVLKYAQRARKIKNKPVINEAVHAVQMEELKNEVNALRHQLLHSYAETASSGVSFQLTTSGLILQQKIMQLENQCMNYKNCMNSALEIFEKIQHVSFPNEQTKTQINNWLYHTKQRTAETGGHGDIQPSFCEHTQMTKQKNNDKLIEEEISKVAKLRLRLTDLEKENLHLKSELNCAKPQKEFSGDMLLMQGIQCRHMHSHLQLFLQKIDDFIGHTDCLQTSKPLLKSTGSIKVIIINTNIGKPTYTKKSESEKSDISLFEKMPFGIENRLNESVMNMQIAQQKLRDFDVNISLKENLMSELVKRTKDAEAVSQQYQETLAGLETELKKIKADLVMAKKGLSATELKGTRCTEEKELHHRELQQDMKTVQHRISSLKRQSMEAEKLYCLAHTNARTKVEKLEAELSVLHEKRTELQTKLYILTKNRHELEAQLHEEREKMNMKLKQELKSNVPSVRRSEPCYNRQTESETLEFQKKWIESELERVLNERKQMYQLQKNLLNREEMISKKEALLKEKEDLEMKKLRSSQKMSAELVTISESLDDVKTRLSLGKRKLYNRKERDKAKIAEDIKNLQKEKDELYDKKIELEEQLNRGSVLTALEERWLLELEEAVAAVDVAIDFKTKRVHLEELNLRKSQVLKQNQNSFVNRLHDLDVNDLTRLLECYFEKVVTLREAMQQKQLEIMQVNIEVGEKQKRISELEFSLSRSAAELDRKVTQIQADYEMNTNGLLHYVHKLESEKALAEQRIEELESKLHNSESMRWRHKKQGKEHFREVNDLTPIGEIENTGILVTASLPLKGKWDELSLKQYSQSIDHIHCTNISEFDPVIDSEDKSDKWAPIEMSSRPCTETSFSEASSSSRKHRVQEKVRQESKLQPASVADDVPKEPDMLEQPSPLMSLLEKGSTVSKVETSPKCSTPVKLPRKQLRQLSKEELDMRQSKWSDRSIVRDSIEVCKENT